MKDKLIHMLENESIEIIFNSRVPYLAIGPTDDYGLLATASIGDDCLTGYQGIFSENVSQDTMDKLKSSIIELLKSEEPIRYVMKDDELVGTIQEGIGFEPNKFGLEIGLETHPNINPNGTKIIDREELKKIIREKYKH